MCHVTPMGDWQIRRDLGWLVSGGQCHKSVSMRRMPIAKPPIGIDANKSVYAHWPARDFLQFRPLPQCRDGDGGDRRWVWPLPWSQWFARRWNSIWLIGPKPGRRANGVTNSRSGLTV